MIESSDDEPLINASTERIIHEDEDEDEDPVDYGCLGSAALCNPNHRAHRFVVLFFICFLAFGSYYCYDNPAALAPQFKSDLGLEVLISFYLIVRIQNVSTISLISGYELHAVILLVQLA